MRSAPPISMHSSLHVTMERFPGLSPPMPLRAISSGDLRVPAWPPGIPAAVVTGDPTKEGLYVVRLKIPAGYKIPAHTHSQDEHITVVSGSLHFGLGGKLNEANAKVLTVYGNECASKGIPHFAFTTEDTILQVHGFGPQSITFVND